MPTLTLVFLGTWVVLGLDMQFLGGICRKKNEAKTKAIKSVASPAASLRRYTPTSKGMLVGDPGFGRTVTPFGAGLDAGLKPRSTWRQRPRRFGWVWFASRPSKKARW